MIFETNKLSKFQISIDFHIEKEQTSSIYPMTIISMVSLVTLSHQRRYTIVTLYCSSVEKERGLQSDIQHSFFRMYLLFITSRVIIKNNSYQLSRNSIA